MACSRCTLCEALVAESTAVIRCGGGGGGLARDALKNKGTQRRPQKQLDRRLVGGGYCRLQMPWRLALAVRRTAARRTEFQGTGCAIVHLLVPGHARCVFAHPR